MLKKLIQLYQYSDNYSKTSGSLWQYCRDGPDLNDASNKASFKFKHKITGKQIILSDHNRT